MNDSRSGLTWLIPPGIAALTLSLSLLPGLPAAADSGAQSDPGVARLSDLAGGVDMRRSDSNDAFAGALNAPVGVGDYLTTRHDAHAEVEFNNASLVRIAPDSQVRFVKLDANAHELQLAEGTVEMRVIKGLEAHPVIDTPEVTIRPLEAGRYRVNVNHDGNTEVTVRSGKAEAVVGDNFAKRIVTPGSSLLVEGDGPQAQIRGVQDVAFDDFDRYGADRDQRWNNPNPTAYEDQGIVGANDLDGYGHWTDAAEYGPGWQPNEPASWSPYSDGRWVWQPYYGWTWVGNEPWGYAPYHYGRWLYTAAGWVWYPGAYAIDQPYEYAPAEVGFFGDGVGGDGININFNFGGGNIGWTPLAPFETLSRWWGGGSNGLAGLASLGSFGGNSYGGSSYGNSSFGNGNYGGGYRHNGGGYNGGGYNGSGYNGSGYNGSGYNGGGYNGSGGYGNGGYGSRGSGGSGNGDGNGAGTNPGSAGGGTGANGFGADGNPLNGGGSGKGAGTGTAPGNPTDPTGGTKAGSNRTGLPYANSGAPGGAMGTSTANFAAGRFDDVHALGRSELAGLSPLKGLLPVIPTAANLAYNGKGSTTTGEASALSSRFSQLQPLAKQVVSFEQQRAAVESAVNARQTGASNGMSTESNERERSSYADQEGRSESSRPSYAAPAQNETRAETSGGTAWDRFNHNPGSQSATASEDRAQTGDTWSRFNRSDAPQNDLRPTRDNVPSYAARSENESSAFSRFGNGSRSESAPSYSEQRSYSEQSRSYSGSPSYSQSRSYSEPARSYSQPRQYSEPSRSYSQPRYSEPRSSARSAPSHSESRGSDHSSHKDNSKRR